MTFRHLMKSSAERSPAKGPVPGRFPGSQYGSRRREEPARPSLSLDGFDCQFAKIARSSATVTPIPGSSSPRPSRTSYRRPRCSGDHAAARWCQPFMLRIFLKLTWLRDALSSCSRTLQSSLGICSAFKFWYKRSICHDQYYLLKAINLSWTKW